MPIADQKSGVDRGFRLHNREGTPCEIFGRLQQQGWCWPVE